METLINYECDDSSQYSIVLFAKRKSCGEIDDEKMIFLAENLLFVACGNIHG